MTERPLVRSFDADDVLVDRGSLLRVWGLAAEKVRLGRSSTVTLGSIPALAHSAVDTPVNSFERLFVIAHSRRKLKEGVRLGLLQTFDSEEDSVNIVNTGRSSKKKWVQMTKDQFARLGIDIFFQRYSFKPSGPSSTESKLDVIRSLIGEGNDVEHYDDDPRTVLAIADLFPNVKVNLIHHTATGMMIPASQLDDRPNIHVISSISESLPG